jgi:hypothetical protein
MIEGVDIRLVKAGDSSVFFEYGSELPGQQVARPGSFQRKDTLELVIVEHWNFDFAPPTPEELHRLIYILEAGLTGRSV